MAAGQDAGLALPHLPMVENRSYVMTIIRFSLTREEREGDVRAGGLLTRTLHQKANAVDFDWCRPYHCYESIETGERFYEQDTEAKDSAN